MNATSIDIKDMLQDNLTLGLIFGTNLFVGYEPNKPDSCVTIYDTPGFPCGLAMDGDTGYEYPAVQISIRSSDYVEGFNMAQSIKEFLHGTNHTIRNNAQYQVMNCMCAPFMLNRDENRRVRFVVNFDIQRSSI